MKNDPATVLVLKPRNVDGPLERGVSVWVTRGTADATFLRNGKQVMNGNSEGQTRYIKAMSDNNARAMVAFLLIRWRAGDVSKPYWVFTIRMILFFVSVNSLMLPSAN
jgi:hypothetical protein